jgi:hypothetical protein
MKESKKTRRGPPPDMGINIENFITGPVRSVSVKGVGPNSAQLLFVVEATNGSKAVPIVVTSYPGYEPQVFASMASFVTTAHFLGKEITAGYYTPPGETSRAIEVFSPPRATRKAAPKKAK